MKIVPYVPRAPKPKPKSKARSIATTKTAEHSRSEVSFSEGNGESLHIDDLPLPDLVASRSFDPAVPVPFGAAGASGSLDYGITHPLNVTSQQSPINHG